MKEASLGIRWLLSLWFQIYSDSLDMPDLLIIDEPGFNMHPGAQKDLVSIFEQIVDSLKCQIIYTTHSPFMINPNRILDVRLIKDNVDHEEKKRYSVVDIKPYKANFEPLCAALGLRFVRPYLLLEKGSDYIVVEGETEAVLLIALSQLCFFHGLGHLDLNNIAVYPAGGATKERYINALNNIASCSQEANAICLFDGDTQGIKVKSEIEEWLGSIRYDNIEIGTTSTFEILELTNSTIEDVVPVDIYINALKKFYTDI
jgi:predicted ATP-dependent endonuclease of OLD family